MELATFPPFFFRNIAGLFHLSLWASGGALEYDSKIPTVFMGIIFDARVKERRPCHFHSFSPEFGETIPTVIYCYFCSNVVLASITCACAGV